MKITKATVTQVAPGGYSATVIVLDEGKTWEGKSGHNMGNPTEAVNSAFSAAVRLISEQLRSTISVNLSVTF